MILKLLLIITILFSIIKNYIILYNFYLVLSAIPFNTGIRHKVIQNNIVNINPKINSPYVVDFQL